MGARASSAEEQGALVLVGDVAELLVHAVAHDHAARDVGRLGEIVGGAGREVAEDELLGRPAAEQHRHLVLQLFARHQEAVLGRALDRVAERADAARDDRDLVHRIGAGQRQRDQRMAHLVIGDDLALLRVEQAVASSRARRRCARSRR